jgi:hypothetical protein
MITNYSESSELSTNNTFWIFDFGFWMAGNDFLSYVLWKGYNQETVFCGFRRKAVTNVTKARFTTKHTKSTELGYFLSKPS